MKSRDIVVKMACYKSLRCRELNPGVSEKLMEKLVIIAVVIFLRLEISSPSISRSMNLLIKLLYFLTHFTINWVSIPRSSLG